MPTYHELKAQAESLLLQAQELREKEKAAAIADIRAKMAEFDLSMADISGTKPARSGRERGSAKRRTKGVKLPPKYADDQGNTWSGRGIKPRWLQQALADGKSLEHFAV